MERDQNWREMSFRSQNPDGTSFQFNIEQLEKMGLFVRGILRMLVRYLWLMGEHRMVFELKWFHMFWVMVKLPYLYQNR